MGARDASLMSLQSAQIKRDLEEEGRANFLQMYADFRRVLGSHCLQRIPVRDARKINPQRRCIVCKQNGIRKDSRFCCPACPGEPGFCRLNDCFATFHHTAYGMPLEALAHLMEDMKATL